MSKALIQAAQALSEKQAFEPGQLVTWKPMLRNKKQPAYGNYAVVTRVLQEPVTDGEGGSGSPYFREPLDVVCGIFDADGDFTELYLDSRRLTLG